MSIQTHEYELLKKHILAWGKTYDVIFYIPIEFALVNDGVRSTDEEYRLKIDRYILDILRDNNVKYYTITGNIPDRLSKIKQIIYDVMCEV